MEYLKVVKRLKRKFHIKGYPILDAKFIEIQTSDETIFDLWIKTSTLSKGNKLYLPTKKHKQFNYWNSKGKLIKGCELHADKVIVWFEIENENYKEGKAIGVDIGMIKLIATNEGKFHGKKMGELLDKIARKKKGSNAYKRALKERNIFINGVVKELDWNEINILCYENLKNMKKGKTGRRKFAGFRKRQKHWSYRQVISRIIEKCEENRVRPIYVNPKNTSRECPICGNVSEANRTGEYFCCLTCGYKQDADTVGAMNILNRGMIWLGSLESPNKKSCK